MTVKVTFLLDISNNWMEEYLVEEKRIFELGDYDFEIMKDHNLVADRDIVFILGYTRILDNDFLNSNGLNLVIHESDLPKGKGWSPVSWQVLEGVNKIPVTLFEADKDIDSGVIYLKDFIELEGSELLHEIKTKQGLITNKLIEKFIASYPDIKGREQIGKSTFYTFV